MTDEHRTGGDLPATAANRHALRHVRELAERDRPRHLARIARVLADRGIEVDASELCRALVRAPVTINFHPDRLLSDGRTVAEALAAEGVYRSQFESGISSGALTAHAGGGRDRWERRLFGGAYQQPGVTPAERPRYGGLNRMNHLDGTCPRFGSCHLRLRPAILDRCTFSLGDSVLEPQDVGVAGAMEPVLAALLEATAGTGAALGRRGVDVPGLIGLLARTEAPTPAPGRVLDDYIEAQIHTLVRLSSDVEGISLDPSFRDTATGGVLVKLATRLGIRISWLPALQLTLSEIPTDVPADPDPEPRLWKEFCAGGRAARLGRMIIEEHAGDGLHLDAATLGRASASAVREPERWRAWGAAADVQRSLKYLWLILLAHGEPGPAPAGTLW